MGQFSQSSFIFHHLLKMEPIRGSETSAFNNNQTPGKYPEELLSSLQHRESLKQRTSRFFKMWLISWLYEVLVAFQGGLCSMELVGWLVGYLVFLIVHTRAFEGTHGCYKIYRELLVWMVMCLNVSWMCPGCFKICLWVYAYYIAIMWLNDTGSRIENYHHLCKSG